jgi:DNA repair protein RadC
MRTKEPAYYKMPITRWPEAERPREKLMRSGPHRLSETELLAILLRSGAGSHSAIDAARELLQKAGGIVQLAEMSYDEILHLKVPGIGKTKAVTIVAAVQLARRLQSEAARPAKPIIRSSDQVAKIYIPRLCSLKKEIFVLVLLASNNSLIREVIISEGVLNASVVTPREVFKEAVVAAAAAIILIHNHPSGNLEPSPEDLQITRQMKAVGEAMNIPVLDHLIIAGNAYTSFLDRGLL